MNYINTQTGEYPIHEYALREMFSNISFPSPFQPPEGFAEVQWTEAPPFDNISQQSVEQAPVEVNGKFLQVWAIEDRTSGEAAARLADAKAAKNNQINAWRLAANRSTFLHGGKTFACDELSRSDIDGVTSFVTLNGALPPGWPGGWKAQDNTYYAITDVAGWTAFVGSMVAAGNAHFARSQTLKAQLATATTTAEINAIQW